MIRPSPEYNSQNEAQFRNEVEQRDLQSVRTDRAAPFVLLTGDDNQVYRVIIVGGALTATAVTV